MAPPETFTDLQLASANTLSSFHLISSMRRRFCAALISHQANGGIERAISFVLQQTSALVREASPPPAEPDKMDVCQLPGGGGGGGGGMKALSAATSAKTPLPPRHASIAPHYAAAFLQPLADLLHASSQGAAVMDVLPGRK